MGDRQFGGVRDQQYGGRGGGSDYSAMNRGGYLPEAPRGPVGPGDIAGIERAYREGLRDLSQMRGELGGDNPEVARDIQELIREMQRLDPSRFQGNPALVEQLRTQVLSGLEQLELQMRRKLDDASSQARTGAARPVPNGYQDSVAEYFRRLSKGK
jgi:hypothetical protein